MYLDNGRRAVHRNRRPQNTPVQIVAQEQRLGLLDQWQSGLWQIHADEIRIPAQGYGRSAR